MVSPALPRTPLHIRRAQVLMVVGVIAICAAVWFAAATQRSTAHKIADQREANTQMLLSMLDQETAVRGFIIAEKDALLAPYVKGVPGFERAAQATLWLAGSRELVTAVDHEIEAARVWQATARDVINGMRLGLRDEVVDGALDRKQKMDAFRRANAAVAVAIDRAAVHAEHRAALVPIVLIVMIAALLGGGAYVLVVRRHRAEERAWAERREENAARADTPTASPTPAASRRSRRSCAATSRSCCLAWRSPSCRPVARRSPAASGSRSTRAASTSRGSS